MTYISDYLTDVTWFQGVARPTLCLAVQGRRVFTNRWLVLVWY